MEPKNEIPNDKGTISINALTRHSSIHIFSANKSSNESKRQEVEGKSQQQQLETVPPILPQQQQQPMKNNAKEKISSPPPQPPPAPELKSSIREKSAEIEKEKAPNKSVVPDAVATPPPGTSNDQSKPHSKNKQVEVVTTSEDSMPKNKLKAIDSIQVAHQNHQVNKTIHSMTSLDEVGEGLIQLRSRKGDLYRKSHPEESSSTDNSSSSDQSTERKHKKSKRRKSENNILPAADNLPQSQRSKFKLKANNSSGSKSSYQSYSLQNRRKQSKRRSIFCCGSR